MARYGLPEKVRWSRTGSSADSSTTTAAKLPDQHTKQCCLIVKPRVLPRDRFPCLRTRRATAQNPLAHQAATRSASEAAHSRAHPPSKACETGLSGRAGDADQYWDPTGWSRPVAGRVVAPRPHAWAPPALPSSPARRCPCSPRRLLPGDGCRRGGRSHGDYRNDRAPRACPAPDRRTDYSELDCFP